MLNITRSRSLCYVTCVVRMKSMTFALAFVFSSLMAHLLEAKQFQDGANIRSSVTSDNKKKFVSAEHFSNPVRSKRSFDSIGYFSDMEQAAKRSGLGISRRLAFTDHSPDLSRPKKAFDSVDDTTADTDAKRRFSSADAVDAAALKRIFDSIGDMSDLSGVKKRFDSIAHYSDMNDIKRNDNGGGTDQRSPDVGSSQRQFNTVSLPFDLWELKESNGLQ